MKKIVDYDYLQDKEDRLKFVQENDFNIEDVLSNDIQFLNSRNGWVQVGNEVYLFGGRGVAGTLLPDPNTFENGNATYKYNLKTRVWTKLSNMPYFMNEQRAVQKDGIIYLFGGNKKVDIDSGYSSGHFNMKYTIATNTFDLLEQPMDMIARTSGAVLLGDKVFVFVDNIWVGGIDTAINTTPYVFDLVSKTWAKMTPTNVTFDRGYAIYYDGLIYVQRSLKFQAYNPITNTWVTNLTPPTYGVVHTGLPQVYKNNIIIGDGWESAKGDNTPYSYYKPKRR